MIYFIKMLAGSETPVKIGYTGNLKNRFSQLQASSPFPLLIALTMPGGLRDESAAHHRFADLHIRGDWFNCRGTLKELLEATP